MKKVVSMFVSQIFEAMMALFNRVPGSDIWSKARRIFSYFVLMLSFLLLAETITAHYVGKRVVVDQLWMALILLTFSVIYFSVVIVYVIFSTNEKFRPNPTRLAADTVNSIIFCVLSFSVLYDLNGISLTASCNSTASHLDSIYFSAVTFSTLGYGDFRPCESTRLYAAFQAIFGNLHLGLIVGSAFFMAQKNGK